MKLTNLKNLISKEQYHIAKATWAKSSCHSATEHILYNILRGFDPSRGFTPILESNYSKIDSRCQDRWNGINQPLKWLEFDAKYKDFSKRILDTFGIELDAETLDTIRGMLSKRYG